MGIKYGGTHYYGTRGSIAQTYFNATSKSDAKVNVSMLPKEVQASAKRFFNRASNSYDSFSASEDTSGNVILIKENPGSAHGSRAIYFLVIDSKGNKIDSYKETYDPEGNLVHRKEK